MKGQVFILISIFVLLFLFSLRMSTETIETKQEDMFFEEFTNLKRELTRTIDTSLLNQQNLQSNLEDFIALSKEFYNRKGYAEEVEYSIETGPMTTVHLNISLTTDKSYLKQSLIIKRTLAVFV